MKKIICFETSFGWINASEENQKIVSVSFGKVKEEGSSKNLKKLKKNIINYFSGKIIKQNYSLKIIGSSLKKKILKELSKISHGDTKSYGYIAKKFNTSPRYVGKVCGQNKHLLLIPCHRVIKSDGQLGGFSGLGGLKLKKRLINLELLN